jgi:hypothetical protein
VSPEEIAVVFRDPARYLSVLGMALSEAGIDAEWDVRLPFLASGIGRALNAAIRASRGDRSAQMDLLRTPYSPADDALLDDLDRRCRKQRHASAIQMERWASGLNPEVRNLLRDIRLAARATGTPEGMQRWYRTVTSMLGRAWPGQASAAPDFLLDAAAARVFIEIIEGATLLGEGGDRIEAITAALDNATIPLTPHARAGFVQVMGAERIKGRRFACVIVGGLMANEFPRTEREDALAAPAIRAALTRAGIDMSPRSSIERERLLYYQVVTRADRRVVLSWQSHDADGRPLRPSLFLEETLDLFRDPATGEYFGQPLPLRTLRLDGFEEHLGAPSSERRSLRSAVRRLGEGEVTVAGARSQRCASALTRASARTPRLSSSEAAILASRAVFSVTEIEAYLQCRSGGSSNELSGRGRSTRGLT